ncbi:MAG TPA: A/G-specific adenine glycosylase [Dehalococcoidia bacterium]
MAVAHLPEPSPAFLDALHDCLLRWFQAEQRDLPWRRTTDPYQILVSEVMLQQTQVARVVPKFREFIARFPTLESLAAAPPAEVIRAWQGLGYNRRAVRLHAMARQMVERWGRVPEDLADLLSLEGVGRYTAAAVAAFAYGAQAAAVDTNVRRVVGRLVLGSEAAAPSGRRLEALAERLLPPGRARQWNAALMDLGALVCVAGRPRCEACPAAGLCRARAVGWEGGAVAAERRPRRVAEAPARYQGSTRYYRGRIVEALRALPAGASLDVESLGRRVREDFCPEHRAWLEGLVRGLERDGLLQVARDGDGGPWVCLP